MVKRFCVIGERGGGAPNKGRLPETRWRFADGFASNSGYKPDAVTRANARASESREIAACRLWLLAIARSSYWLSSSSLKTFHHVPFGIWSVGLAACHGAGDCQLSGMVTSGFLYFGPPAKALAPANKNTPASASHFMIVRPPVYQPALARLLRENLADLAPEYRWPVSRRESPLPIRSPFR